MKHNYSSSKPFEKDKSVSRLLKYIFQHHKFGLIFTLFMVIVSSASMVLASMLLQPLVDKLILPNIGVENPDLTKFFQMMMLIGVIYVISTISSFAYNIIMVRITHKTLTSLRCELFNKIQKMPISYLDKNASGDLMSLFTNDCDAIRVFIGQSIPQVFNSILLTIGIVIGMFVLSWLLALFTIAALIGTIFASGKISSKGSKYFNAQQKSLAKVNGYVEEMLNGQKVVKVFSHEDKILTDFLALSEELRQSAQKAFSLTNILQPIATNLGYLNYVIVAVVGAILMLVPGVKEISGVQLGVLISFLQFTRMLFQPISTFSTQLQYIISAQAGGKRIFDVLDQKEEDLNLGAKYQIIKNTEGKYEIRWNDNGTVKAKELVGKVEFKNVYFSYVKGTPILKNISFLVNKGEKIAFVGSTGAGKTTITSLVNRFYDVDSGEILIDDINIKDFDIVSLRESMAYVLQDTHLFTGKVSSNIRYGRLDASDDEVKQSAKIANAHVFIKYLENGYDTQLLQSGAQLSQGQRQLLSIARASIADRAFLFLDEATSSIDTRTEKLIQDGLNRLMNDYTVFIIAHRLSTVKDADQIIVLEKGEIIERGNHEELLKLKGVYYELYNGQKQLD